MFSILAGSNWFQCSHFNDWLAIGRICAAMMLDYIYEYCIVFKLLSNVWCQWNERDCHISFDMIAYRDEVIDFSFHSTCHSLSIVSKLCGRFHLHDFNVRKMAYKTSHGRTNLSFLFFFCDLTFVIFYICRSQAGVLEPTITEHQWIRTCTIVLAYIAVG